MTCFSPTGCENEFTDGVTTYLNNQMGTTALSERFNTYKSMIRGHRDALFKDFLYMVRRFNQPNFGWNPRKVFGDEIRYESVSAVSGHLFAL